MDFLLIRVRGHAVLRARSFFAIVLIALLLAVGTQVILPAPRASAARKTAPPGPDRIVPITVTYTAYTWWMASWHTNDVVCSIVVDHKGMPKLPEIYQDCDPATYKAFVDQPPCLSTERERRECIGYYMYLVDTQKSQREIPVTLPPAEVWLSLEGCDAVSRSGTNICETTPVLVLQAYEPLPNEHILRIEGTIGGSPFACDPTCKIQLSQTVPQGVKMQFWAYSSYGDSSEVFSAQVRVAPAADQNPDQTSLYVDVLSTQWRGVRIASCSDVWDSFPPVGGPPAWLSTPADPADLTSDIPYNYLAANLILQGVVNASSCPDGGLTPDGGASACGQELARDAVDQWQNQFDGLIMQTSNETGVPAQLLKNLFARESQFWPGIFKASIDAGLGQLTTNGADSTLLWNRSFFKAYCPLVLSEDRCAKGYVHLKDDEQKLLRDSLVASVNASCTTCALGIDLSRANFSVTVFAHTLLASCEQTAQVVYNTVGQDAGNVASYEDLWKLTLVNYNAGPGCLSLVVNEAWNTEHELTWDTLSNHFTKVCSPAKDYVNDISK